MITWQTWLATALLGMGSNVALMAAGRPANLPRFSNPVPDNAFVQEIHVPHPLTADELVTDIRAVSADDTGTVWAATRQGVFRLPSGNRTWIPAVGNGAREAAFDVFASPGGDIWVGSWNGIHRATPDGRMIRVGAVEHPIGVLTAYREGVLAAGPDGLWHVSGDQVTPHAFSGPGSVRAMLTDPASALWIATDLGLVRQSVSGTTVFQTVDGPVSCALRGLALDDAGRLWAGGLGGLWIYRDHRLVDHLAPSAGLPSAEVTCIERAPDGAIWVGTRAGIARFARERSTIRRGRRWLVGDEVRDISFDRAGSAWIATAGGISELRPQQMTLAAKAAHYHAICEARHVRPPGIVEKCRLRVPGDLSTWEPQDDDNDGGYTAVYLAMESFRYSATRSPVALENARRAFGAMEFLQRVTGTPGFIARTAIPVEWNRMADPNESLPPAEIAERRVSDPRYKDVPDRWRVSADGRWRWKGDTSSDEITAHLFGCFFFHELAADDDDRARIRDLVCRIVDHLIDGGMMLRDLDGQPTRWGVWSPARLKHDPNWASEKGINAVEILSYLKLAAHLSGEPKYTAHYQQLLHEHGYRQLVLLAKNVNPAARTHIDDELLAFAYPALLILETDGALRRLYRRSFDRWHAAVRDDCQPFFEFLHRGLTGSPRNWEPSMASLRDTPLDLIRWETDNSTREDVRQVRAPELEQWQTERLLPPSERTTFRTDENPRRTIQGDGGQTESDGVFWLLPYWMGRHFGIIAGEDDPPPSPRDSTRLEPDR